MKKTLLILLTILLVTLSTTSIFAHDKGKIPASEVEKIQVYPSITKLHPPTTHFAIGFPIFLLLAEILYLITKRKPDIIELFMVIVAVGGVLLGTISGLYIYYNMQEPVIKEAHEVFEAHEILGIILSIIYLVILGIRILYEVVKDEKAKSLVRWIYLSILAFSVLLLLYQGWLGGVMVYEYGIGVIYQYLM
ncbi:MAG: DUF2231 domain-containing protein [Brevinematales bacterium]|nr:DUF2231 domain-containing protein [Brevinematales bacterium]